MVSFVSAQHVFSFVATAKARHNDVVFAHCRLPESFAGNQSIAWKDALAPTIPPDINLEGTWKEPGRTTE